jgi:tetratricopeptide (TPR) repeat protein
VTHPPLQWSVKRFSIIRLVIVTLAAASLVSTGLSADAEFDPDGFNLFAPLTRDEETVRALEPPRPVAVPQQPASGSATVQYGRNAPARGQPPERTGGIVISPPATNLPTAYYDLPLQDLPPLAEGIPGVLLPELDDSFQEPYPTSRGAALRARAYGGGMSIRQLEPFFALAKGTEGRALEAKRSGEPGVFVDQLTKSIAAYMDIISMADASGEAREEAWYGVARCEYRLENWWRAFEAIERSFPKTFAPDEVAGRVRLEMFIGERLWRAGDNAARDAIVEGRQLSGYQAASQVYAAVLFNQPSANDAPLALLRRGDAAALHHDNAEAAKYYRQLITYYPDNEHALQARSSLAEAIYRQDWPAGLPEAARDDVASIMADVERSQGVLSEEAATRRERAVAVVNDDAAGMKLRHAKEYLTSMRTRRSRQGAITLLSDVVTMYPGTPQAGEAREILVSLGVQPPRPLPEPASPFAIHDPFADFDRTGAGDMPGDSYITLDVPADIPDSLP